MDSSEWHDARLDPGLNAYVDWILGPGREYSIGRDPAGDVWFPVIARLKKLSVDDVRREFSANIIIPGIYDSMADEWGDEPFVSALVKPEFFEILTQKNLTSFVSEITIGLPIRSESVADDPQEEPPPEPGDPQRSMVVVGVIDDGLAFAHERFSTIDEHGQRKTRIEYVWLQDAVAPGPGSPVVHGREYKKARIDHLIQEFTTSGSVDEDGLYRKVGLADFRKPEHKSITRRIAHGTHVMDLACGAPPDEAPKDLPIVCVQLPAVATEDTSGTRLEPQVLAGVDYIIDRAERVASREGCGQVLVVINFSYGFSAGPHDGTHPIEAAIDQRLSRNRNLSVVVPSGNTHLARSRAKASFQSPSAEVPLKWRVLPDDRTSSFVEIWLPYTEYPPEGGRLQVKVTPPGGETSPALGETHGDALVWKPRGDVLCKLSYEFFQSTGRGRFTVAILPTAFHDAPTQLAPSGAWKITLCNRSLSDQQCVEAWIQRDDTPYGYPRRGRQSYFDDDRYVRFDPVSGREIEVDDGASPVLRDGSISAIATGREAVVIGGYLRKEFVPARYSAGGPVTPQGNANPHRAGPDALAVSDDSRVHQGVLAAGSRSGCVVAMNGTSAAAPQVARMIAKALARGQGGDRTSVGNRAEQDENPVPLEQRLPPERGGRGRLRLPPVRPLARYWP